MVERLVVAALLALAVSGCKGCSEGPSGTAGSDAAPGSAGGEDAAVVNVTVLPTASVAAKVNPEDLPPYDGPTGSVEGTISVTGDPPIAAVFDFSRCPQAEAIWGKSFREGDPVPSSAGARALADAVVAVTGYKGYVPAKDEAKQIDIEGCGYKARTAVLTFGQRLDVKNLSKDFWTPVLQPGPTSVMMMAAPHGDPVRLYPKKPGRYLVVDRDRRYVDVDVFVLLQPLATVTDTRGHFRIDGIPVGKVKVSTMHPRFVAEAGQEVEIRSGIIARVDLALKHTAPDAGAGQPEDAGYHPPLR